MAWSSWYRVESTWSSAARSPSCAASSHWVIAVSAIKLPPLCSDPLYTFALPVNVSGGSALAAGAPDGAALADPALAEGAAAARAWIAAPAVGGEFLFEVAGGAVGREEVAQG